KTAEEGKGSTEEEPDGTGEPARQDDPGRKRERSEPAYKSGSAGDEARGQRGHERDDTPAYQPSTPTGLRTSRRRPDEPGRHVDAADVSLEGEGLTNGSDLPWNRRFGRWIGSRGGSGVESEMDPRGLRELFERLVTEHAVQSR